MAEHRQIFRAMFFSNAASIFVKSDIQRPMQFILNAPVRPDCLVPETPVILATRIAVFTTFLVPDPALRTNT